MKLIHEAFGTKTFLSDHSDNPVSMEVSESYPGTVFDSRHERLGKTEIVRLSVRRAGAKNPSHDIQITCEAITMFERSGRSSGEYSTISIPADMAGAFIKLVSEVQ